MRAAAQFQRIGLPIRALARSGQAAHRHHAHFVAVFFPKQRLCANGAGVIGRHDAGIDGGVLADVFVHLRFNRGQFGGSHPLPMAKIKPQPIWRVQAATLGHMIAQGAAQRFVQQVRGRVVGANLRAACAADIQLGRLALKNRAFNNLGHMNKHPRRFTGIGHFSKAGLRADKAVITHLATAFGVERRLVDHDLHR